MASANLGKMAGMAMAAGGASLVFLQFSGQGSEQKDMPEEVKRSPLKKTLSNAGLYPEPQKKLNRTASGSMAAFTQGGDALTKGGGDPM